MTKIPSGSAIFEETSGDALLYLEPNRRLGHDRGATFVVQTDEERAMFFELTPPQRRALGMALLREGPATGCAHVECYEEEGTWPGCRFMDPDELADLLADSRP